MKLDCMPTAMANLFKWSGKKFSYTKQRFYLYRMFKFDPERGTSFKNCDRVLKKPIKDLIIKRKINADYKSIVKHLSESGCILLSYQKDNGAFHSVLVIKDNKNTVSIVNYHNGKVISLISKKIFKKYTERCNTAYFVKKK